jgi:thiamine biosynthesis protein ThiI
MLIVAHYHEISLKGKNRPSFIRQLVRNIERATSDLPVRRVTALPGRLLVVVEGEEAWPEVARRLQTVMGIANFARAYRVEADVGRIARRALRALGDRRFDSFRVSTRRVDKSFHLNSMEIDREVGRLVQQATGAAVNLGAPELTVHVELLPRRAFVYFDKVEGARGMPVGSAGRVMALLSGGIDSPVASWRMMRRGCRVDFVHFHSVPFLSRASQVKAKELVERLTRYQYVSRIFLVPFGELQRQVMLGVAAPLRVVLYRRFMMRIAARLGVEAGAGALVTGESLGQVASQTLENLVIIGSASDLPVLRPLIGMDKDEITAQAKSIGTYSISIQPDQDCCQLFIPPHPATRARADEVAAAESRLDVEELVSASLGKVEQVTLGFPRPSARSTCGAVTEGA